MYPGGASISPRFHHSAQLYKDSIFVYGGTDGNDTFHDTFELKLSNVFNFFFVLFCYYFGIFMKVDFFARNYF
jgi:hypothetical protein